MNDGCSRDKVDRFAAALGVPRAFMAHRDAPGEEFARFAAPVTEALEPFRDLVAAVEHELFATTQLSAALVTCRPDKAPDR